jgi:hypothetical protein
MHCSGFFCQKAHHSLLLGFTKYAHEPDIVDPCIARASFAKKPIIACFSASPNMHMNLLLGSLELILTL